MKLKLIKLFQVIIFFSLLLVFVPEKVEAGTIPLIIGHVVTSTGAPVVGVWAKWTDDDGNVYYEKTNNIGNFIFDAQLMTYGSDGPMIDTNLDGVNDTRQGVIAPGSSADKSHSCMTNPHTISVVLPAGWNGSFSVISGIKFNNGQANITLPDIIYTPSVAPTPTPIPPTPIPPDPFTKVVNFGIYLVSGISGNVFIDDNLDGLRDGGESAYTGGAVITITGTSFAQTTTDSSGNYSFPNLPNGSYTVFETIPAGYSSTSPTSKNVTINPGAVVNFGFVGGYTVAGSVFDDANKNQKQDIGESSITGYTLSSTGNGTLNLYRNGTYDIQDLKAGTYTISYTSPLPPGYFMVYPKNGPPASLTFTVGPGCAVDPLTGATCNGNNIDNLNFAISNSIPWMQTYNLGARFENGYTDTIPLAPLYPRFASDKTAESNSPGLIFPGDSFTDFGTGQASSSNWISGGTTYPEITSPSSSGTGATSYGRLLSKAQKDGLAVIDITTLKNCGNLNNCSIDPSVKSGIYQANGNLTLNNVSIQPNRNYLFLVNGTLTINANIVVPNGASALFSAKGDIIISRNVGLANGVFPLPAGQVEGYFSAGRNFVVDGSNDCVASTDRMLNIEGTIMVNVNQTGGKFTNNRDLCGGNPSYPSVTIKGRPDFILNAPQFIMDQSTYYTEVAP